MGAPETQTCKLEGGRHVAPEKTFGSFLDKEGGCCACAGLDRFGLSLRISGFTGFRVPVGGYGVGVRHSDLDHSGDTAHDDARTHPPGDRRLFLSAKPQSPHGVGWRAPPVVNEPKSALSGSASMWCGPFFILLRPVCA